MSRYGRLYEDARHLRANIASLLPGTLSINSVADARTRAASHARHVQDLIDAWQRVENEMAEEPNE